MERGKIDSVLTSLVSASRPPFGNHEFYEAATDLSKICHIKLRANYLG